jgi:polyhydroxyalkanoate synthesis repressor PhaR
VPRTIKRYANRKLYDTSESSYITLEEIAELVQQGEDVRIVDNTSKEDLTAVTLAQILFEAEKQKKRSLPLSTLRGLIRSSGEFIEQKITRPATNIRLETEKRVSEVRDAIERTEDDAREKVLQFKENTQRTWEELQRQMDERFRSVVDSVSNINPVHRYLQDVMQAVAQLEQRISALEDAVHGQVLSSSHDEPPEGDA